MEEVRVSRLPQLGMGLLSSAPAANRADQWKQRQKG